MESHPHVLICDIKETRSSACMKLFSVCWSNRNCGSLDQNIVTMVIFVIDANRLSSKSQKCHIVLKLNAVGKCSHNN